MAHTPDGKAVDAPITTVKPLVRTPRPIYGATQDLGPGFIIGDRYELLEEIAQGGMSTIFRAQDKQAASQTNDIAIKFLGNDFRHHPHALVTLQREAQKTRSLEHPNIICVFDFGKDGDLVFFTMELLFGQSLYDLLKHTSNKKLLTKQTSLNILQQIAEGLSFAHRHGIVHSDLKPGNLFLTNQGKIKILDFGIARAVNEEFDQPLGAITESYASPQMLDNECPHPSDDVFALGIIACELLGGKPLFQKKNSKQFFKENKEVNLNFIGHAGLRLCVSKALDPRRDQRQADANEFLSEFVLTF